MNKFAWIPILTLSALSYTAFAADHDPRHIAAMLKDAKITLLQGIDQAERSSGAVTSAKFEIEDGKLNLSIYTVPEGLSSTPDAATLTELSGDSAATPFAPSAEVFADKEHIARASEHMVLFQLSRFTLKQVIQKALLVKAGTPIDVRDPTVRARHPVADVVIIGNDGAPTTVAVDLQSGCAKLK